jgi:putative mRNA 3-end processing factor
LLTAIRSSGAERVWVTHGYRAQLSHWLEENGLEAHAIDAQYEGERGDGELSAGEAES